MILVVFQYNRIIFVSADFELLRSSFKFNSVLYGFSDQLHPKGFQLD